MQVRKSLAGMILAVAVGAAALAAAQAPAPTPAQDAGANAANPQAVPGAPGGAAAPAGRGGRAGRGAPAYPVRPPADPAVVARGKQIFSVNCSFCHGSDARGGEGGPNLIRSELVMGDKNGEIIATVVQNGRPDKGMPKFDLTLENISDFLGVPKFRDSAVHEKSEIGLVNGLAWTEVGGSILQTEVQVLDGKGKLTTTGQLGDVMTESAQAALSYVRSRAQHLGLPRDFYRNVDIHIHVPEGAIPKDGPSAGITLATALASALARIPVRRDLAMTGEITLRGKVLPIGGLKEKLLAAHRAGIFEAILPEDNRKDLPDIPENLKSAMKLNFVDTMDEVLKIALEAPLPELKEETPDVLEPGVLSVPAVPEQRPHQ